MDEPTTSTRIRSHRIAAAFDSEDDANAALADLRRAHEVHVDVHYAGCHDIDEAERGVGVTMVRSIAITVPVTIVVLLGLGLLFRSALGDQSVTDVLAVAIGAGGIFGILFGGIIGLAISAGRLEEARSPAIEHRAEEVLVAHIERGAIHNPNLRRAAFAGKRDRAIVGELEGQVRQVFEDHHGRLIDA
jgi:hypothetical protein